MRRLIDGQHRPAVDARSGERVEDVGDGGDATAERYLWPGEPIRVPGAIPSFVMRESDDRGQIEQRVAAGASRSWPITR